jgi:hypothetical protein
MGYPDIERGRAGQVALQRIIDGCAGDRADLRALRRVVDLCRELADAVDDDYCRSKILVVCEYAAELLSQGEHRARGALPGAEFLRREIRGALELVQSRLYSIERARRHGEQALARAMGAAAHALKR